MKNIVPLTAANFEEHKKRIIKIIQDLQIEDLDPNFRMSMEQGIKVGNHMGECDPCNILHYLMSFIFEKHRLEIGK